MLVDEFGFVERDVGGDVVCGRMDAREDDTVCIDAFLEFVDSGAKVGELLLLLLRSRFNGVLAFLGWGAKVGVVLSQRLFNKLHGVGGWGSLEDL